MQAVAESSQSPPSERNGAKSSPESASTSGEGSRQSGSFFSSIFDPLQTLAKRAGIYVAFLAAKQPSRIKQVLKQVRFARYSQMPEQIWHF